MYVCLYMHTYIYTYTYICIFIHIHTYIHTYIHTTTYMYVCMCVYKYIYIYIYIYIYRNGNNDTLTRLFLHQKLTGAAKDVQDVVQVQKYTKLTPKTCNKQTYKSIQNLRRECASSSHTKRIHKIHNFCTPMRHTHSYGSFLSRNSG